MAEGQLSNVVIGDSPAMRKVMHIVHQVALYPYTTVLLQGESGTGKEVIAHAIHDLGRRPTSAFVAVNCAAIPETLLETELFGVEAGAFTDARVSRPGLLMVANKGTLFLDEIASMPLSLQAKMLRFLETRSFVPVGSTKEIHVDLRIISATNVDLRVAISQHTFREDLFYRLKVVPILIPPLRDRSEDIDALISYFLQQVNDLRKKPLRISEEARAVLRDYPWPGNVRELRSAIEYVSILCDSDLVQPVHLPDTIRKSPTIAAHRLQELVHQLRLPPEGVNLPSFLRTIEAAFVREALAYSHGNQVRAATLLHLSRDQLRYRLQLLENK